MHPVFINDDEFDRLMISKETHKYGHLKTWKELYIFQRMVLKTDPEKVIKIANYAKRKANGEKITLSLAEFVEPV